MVCHIPTVQSTIGGKARFMTESAGVNPMLNLKRLQGQVS